MGEEATAAVRTACRAAAAVARDHGVHFVEPRVLSVLSSVIVHLPPGPLVARVPLLPEDVRPGDDPLVREVRIAAWLAARGLPAVRPSELVAPGPHAHDGHRVTFWELIAPVEGVPLDARAAGQGLRAIHEALTEYPEPLPFLEPGAEIRSILARLTTLAPDDTALLERELERVEAAVAELGRPRQPVHGDAHSFNVVQTSRGPIWLDFEDACVGAREWDLAALVAHAHVEPPRPEAADILAAYGDVDRTLLEPFTLLRLLWVTAWGAFGAERNPARRSRTETRLAFWRERAAAA
ncbi:MAG: phosphotransferase enzyme family protein [Pseudomonadota bacterium]